MLLLPNLPVNIFGARKLLGRGDIRIEGNHVISRQGKYLFQFDKNLMIIEEPESRTYAFPAISKQSKELPIRLWHRRFGHLGLHNVRKTATIVKGLSIKEEVRTEDEYLRLCDPCERGKPLRHIRKKAEPRVLGICDEIHIDVVMISPKGIGKKKYATVFTDKATSVRWVYFHESKNGAHHAIVAFQKMLKTQYNLTVKVWRMDGGKEYSPNRLTELAYDLGQVVELTTPYNPEQDGTSERSIRIFASVLVRQ